MAKKVWLSLAKYRTDFRQIHSNDFDRDDKAEKLDFLNK